jgi:hypothetical protein
MAQFYKCFIKEIAFIMSPITKLLKKSEVFELITKCQNVWEEIKTNMYLNELVAYHLQFEGYIYDRIISKLVEVPIIVS